ncbi:crustapain-like [Macrosteles quadrilineatus]|uniref:crustapain-like n=1 Tax=Macrosteles quadrilineatus TaxID=74068 RepID=UPI0023E0F320|nr:crustapain-like [Macrosteles quadrilineatus]
MKLLLLFTLVALGCAGHITYSQEEEEQWERFKIKYNRVYANEVEEEYRKAIFIANLHDIREHNQAYERGETTFTEGINDFADWTGEELKRVL